MSLFSSRIGTNYKARWSTFQPDIKSEAVEPGSRGPLPHFSKVPIFVPTFCPSKILFAYYQIINQRRAFNFSVCVFTAFGHNQTLHFTIAEQWRIQDSRGKGAMPCPQTHDCLKKNCAGTPVLLIEPQSGMSDWAGVLRGHPFSIPYPIWGASILTPSALDSP